jgi:hypothetical protein
MITVKHAVVYLSALGFVAGCASTMVKERQEYKGGKVPRPAHIWVYDFAATSAEVPAESVLAGQHAEHATPQTEEQVAAGRQAGATIAAQLVEEIRVMGMPAEHASTGSKPQINDLVIRGYILSADPGDATKRVAIGFGAGESELSAAVEGFQMTSKGLRKLGGGKLGAGGSKTPGSAVGVIGTIATANPAGLIVGTGVKAYGEYSGSSKIEGRAKDAAKEIASKLKPKFQEQGWIQ